MAMRSLWWTAVLLLTLIACTCTQNARYQRFLQQHVDYPKTRYPNNARYCQAMLVRRRVNIRGICKPTNTFVHTRASNLRTICTNQPDGALRGTRRRFPVTVCRLIRSRPTCTYTGRQFNHRVRVNCERGFPVHLSTTY
ncbi:ANGI protein, partial [Alectura lathami]|nr:ANGI protein [Alectura lathami]